VPATDAAWLPPEHSPPLSVAAAGEEDHAQMFGYLGENSTPGSGHTNRADVNKQGYLFGGKGNWLLR